MSDFTPDPDPASPDYTKRRFGLSATQVAASALAAVSSAVAASYLGVAGTVIGAGVGSIVATISTALYQHSLTRTNERLRKVVPVVPGGVRQTESAAGSARASVSAGTSVPAGDSDPDGGESAPAPAPGSGSGSGSGSMLEAVTGRVRRRPVNWPRLAAAAGIVFVVALGSIALFEQFAGGSLSSVVRGGDRHGTTVGDLVRPLSGPARPDAELTPARTGAPGTTASPADAAPTTWYLVTSPPVTPSPSPSTAEPTPSAEPQPSGTPSPGSG